MATYKTCVFCLRNDSKISREDVLPKWIAKAFPADRVIRNVAIDKTYRSKKTLGIIATKPCRRCNNEWMSALEQQVIPLLLPLMQGTPTTLNAEAQKRIAIWLFKTALMYDLHTERTQGTYFTAEECRALKVSQTIPADCMMFLGQYRGEQLEMITREVSFSPDPQKLPESHRNMLEFEAYTASFAIKHLALQLFAFRRPKHLINEILDIEIADWSPAEIQIWPITERFADWPPPRLMDDVIFDRFADRWNDLTLFGR